MSKVQNVYIFILLIIFLIFILKNKIKENFYDKKFISNNLPSDRFISLIENTNFDDIDTEQFNKNEDGDLIDGMIGSNKTPKLLYLAGKSVRKDSVVVEFGCWFGKSSRAVALGLKDNYKNSFFVFDLFKMIDEPDKILLKKNKVKKNDSFIHIFNRNVKQLYPKTKTYEGWITEKSNSSIWKKPADLFLMDCAKDLDNFKIQMVNLADSLRIGSIVVLCDFSWPLSTYSQPAIVYSILKNNLKMIYFSHETSHFFFKVTRKLDKKKIKDFKFKNYSKEYFKKIFSVVIKDIIFLSKKYNITRESKTKTINKQLQYLLKKEF